MRWPNVVSVSALAVALLACDALGPGKQPVPPTLLVINGTCSPGPCQSFSVRGIVPKFAVPGQPPAGMMRLDTVTTDSVCIRFPATYDLVISNTDNAEYNIQWSPDDDITLIAARASFQPLGSGVAFIPGKAAGWQLTLPATQNSTPIARSACQ